MQLVRIHVVSESYRLLVLLLSPSIPSHDHKIYLPIPYGLLFQSLNLFILCASLGEITWHLTFCVWFISLSIIVSASIFLQMIQVYPILWPSSTPLPMSATFLYPFIYGWTYRPLPRFGWEMWLSGRAPALHAEGPGFDPQHPWGKMHPRGLMPSMSWEDALSSQNYFMFSPTTQKFPLHPRTSPSLLVMTLHLPGRILHCWAKSPALIAYFYCIFYLGI